MLKYDDYLAIQIQLVNALVETLHIATDISLHKFLSIVCKTNEVS
jgi:hypothetical protein